MASEALLRTWLKRARESQFAHYAADERLSRLHYIVGVPAAILAAVVGTSVFASLDASVSTSAKIVVGLASMAAAVLTGLQTFWRFSERAERHRAIAGEYARIRREIEQRLSFGMSPTYDMVEKIRKSLDEVAAKAPSISHSDWTSARKAADKTFFLSGSDQPRLQGATEERSTGQPDAGSSPSKSGVTEE